MTHQYVAGIFDIGPDGDGWNVTGCPSGLGRSGDELRFPVAEVWATVGVVRGGCRRVGSAQI